MSEERSKIKKDKLFAKIKKVYPFIFKLDVPDEHIPILANHLTMLKRGTSEAYVTPVATACDPAEYALGWQNIFNANLHRMNSTLIDLELSNRSKFGPRSIAIPWADRNAGLRASWNNQDENHIPRFSYKPGSNKLNMIPFNNAIKEIQGTSSAGLPFLKKKGDAVSELVADFETYVNRKDPCMLYTRTAEKLKTRNVWGFPFADTVYELLFYVSLLAHQRTKFYRAALVSPEMVAQHITILIHNAKDLGYVLYSVDFAAFDASTKFQYIIKAFEYIKSCFFSRFHEALDDICERMYTIPVLTPSGVWTGKHGVPSGSTFTNEVDSIIQLGIASTCEFIDENQCVIQGDDGVYILSEENIPEFKAAFKYAGLKLEESKSVISSNHVIFCQNLYHADYEDSNNVINGIYPTWRAINRLVFHEKQINFKKEGITSQDFYGSRTISILENVKHHPLHEELVRYVLSKEKYSLEISEEGLARYCEIQKRGRKTATSLNHQHGSQVRGLRNFVTYKLVKKILAEEADVDTPRL